MSTTYEFQSHHGDKKTTVLATNEDEARRLAMCALWGTAPDNITPHAPKYSGIGLMLVSARSK